MEANGALWELRQVERALVVQQVVDKSLSAAAAGEKLKLSARQVRRLAGRFRRGGAAGLTRRAGSGRRGLGAALKERCVALVAERYADFGPTLAAEKLAAAGITVGRETLRRWLGEAGLWQPRKLRKTKIYQSRARRPRFGELVQIDGSPHAWFEGRGPVCSLIVMVDDATSRLTAMRFEPAETTFAYMRCVAQHLERHGRPQVYYSDKHSIFRKSREQNEHIFEPTQFHRALQELGINLICANSPQAKGRVERANQTLQDRLVKELRLAKINDIEAGNAFLPGFIEDYNTRFGVAPQVADDAHRPLPTNVDISLILCKKHQRKVSKNLQFTLNRRLYRLRNVGAGHRLRRASITVYELPSGVTKILFENKTIEHDYLGLTLAPETASDKNLNAAVDTLLLFKPTQPALPTSSTAPTKCA